MDMRLDRYLEIVISTINQFKENNQNKETKETN